MAQIDLPALSIPDDKIITSPIDLGLDLLVSNLTFYPFTFFGKNPVDLNIKHVEDRYEAVGNGIKKTPCPALCPFGQTFNCITGLCEAGCAEGKYKDPNTGQCLDYTSYRIDLSNVTGINLSILTKSHYNTSKSAYEVLPSGDQMSTLAYNPHVGNFLKLGGIVNPMASLNETYTDRGHLESFGGYDDVRSVNLQGYTNLSNGISDYPLGTITVTADISSAVDLEDQGSINSTPDGDGLVPTDPFSDPNDVALVHSIVTFTAPIYGVK